MTSSDYFKPDSNLSKIETHNEEGSTVKWFNLSWTVCFTYCITFSSEDMQMQKYTNFTMILILNIFALMHIFGSKYTDFENWLW